MPHFYLQVDIGIVHVQFTYDQKLFLIVLDQSQNIKLFLSWIPKM